MAHFTGTGERVIDNGFDHIFVEFADDIDDFGITDIADIFFESQAEQSTRLPLSCGSRVFADILSAHFRALDRLADSDQLFHGIFGDELAHIIVDSAPGKNDFGVVTDLFGLVGEVVGVDADAVPADQAGEKLEEIPFGAGGAQHFDFRSIKVEPDNIIFQGKSMRERQANITQADYRDLCSAVFQICKKILYMTNFWHFFTEILLYISSRRKLFHPKINHLAQVSAYPRLRSSIVRTQALQYTEAY